MKQKPNGLTKSNSKAGAVEKSEALFILSKREKISLLYGAKTMNKGEYYARKQILELFDYDWQHDCDNGMNYEETGEGCFGRSGVSWHYRVVLR